MIAAPRRRACAFVTALALLIAAALPVGSVRRECAACKPGCPMHAQRLGCHQGSRPSCHRNALGLRSACGHTADPGVAGPGSIRAIIPLRSAPIGRAIVRVDEPPADVLVTQHLPEPPTDPPRTSVLPA